MAVASSPLSFLRHHRASPSTVPSLHLLPGPRRLSVIPSYSRRNPKDIPRWKLKKQPPRPPSKDYSTSFSPLLPRVDGAASLSLSGSQAVGTVAAAHANFMRVIATGSPGGGGRMELLCVVRAVLKKIGRKVLVGDEVLVGSIDWVDRRGMIEDVFQRRTEVTDPPVANVDHFLVMFSLDQPRVEPVMLTRFLVEAESCGIPFTLALNKSELVDDQMLEGWKTRLDSWGYKPVFISVESGSGLDSLASILRDQTTVIMGPSGVGKSSLINALRNKISGDAAEADNWFDPIIGSTWFENQRVGEVSTRSGKGKHTTRNVSLLPLSDGGYLADSPGLNMPSLLKVTKRSLAQAFPEIRRAVGSDGSTRCAFRDCLHLGEPGCIAKGDWERYAFYCQLLDEIRIREEFQLRMFGTKNEGDVRYKVGTMGVQLAEPRLERKKHRRESRKKMNQSLIDELADNY